jgi:hypothetical protein
MEAEVPEPTDDTQARTEEYPQTEAQRADDREDRQAARRAASLPTEVEVPDPPGADIPPLELVSYTPANPGRRKRFPWDGETTIDLSDEEGEDVESLAAFLPPQQERPAERGTLLRPLTPAEWAAALAIQNDPAKFGRVTEARSLFGSVHYSGAVIDNLVPKLTMWAKELIASDNWAFIPPDVLNGLMNGDSNNRARHRVLRSTTADTLFACFFCGNCSHWFLVVADLGSCIMNMGSFEDSIFGSSWGWEVRHADQQQNGYDCRTFHHSKLP